MKRLPKIALLRLNRGDDPRELILDVVHNVTCISRVWSLRLLVILGEDLELVGAKLEHFSNIKNTLGVGVLPLTLFFEALL